MLRKYKPFLRAGAIDTMTFRFNIMIWAVVTVCQVACLVFLWLAVYRSSAGGIDAEIHGFSFREMIAYVVLTTVFNFVTFNNDTMWYINNDIRKGTIGNHLIKPISYRGKFAATSLGSLLTMAVMFGLPFYTAALLALRGLGFLPGLTFPAFFAHLGLFLLSGLCASLLNDVISYIFGVLCFYTTSAWGLNSLKETLVSFLSGTLLPLAFFPAGLRDVLSWMPFAGMSQNPVLILMMKYDLAASLRCVALSAAWIVVLELLAKLLFSHAYKKDTLVALSSFFFSNLCSLAALYFILQSIPALAGYSLYEVGFFYGFSMLPIALDHLFSDELWLVAYRRVKDGDMDMHFLRPVPVLFQVFAETFQPEGFGELILGAALIAVCASNLTVAVTFGSVAVLFVGALFGAVIITSLKVAIAALAFIFKRSGPLLQIIYNFSTYAKYPLAIYPAFIRAFLIFVLPFGLFISLPVDTLLYGKHDPWLLCGAIIGCAAVFFALAVWVWTACERRYESTGS